MRTTLTLDPDVAVQIKKRLKSDISLKSLVNSLLRMALNTSSSEGKKNLSLQTKPHDSGALLISDISNIGEILSRMDEGKL